MAAHPTVFMVWFQTSDDGFDANGQGDDAVHPKGFVELCVSSARKHNKRVVVVSLESIDEYLSASDLLHEADSASGAVKELFAEGVSPAKVSDLVRVALIYKHGGVYIDASCLVLNDFSWITDWSKINAFTLRQWSETDGRGGRYIEPWFLAAPAKTPFLFNLLTELRDHIHDPSSYGEKHMEYLGPDLCDFPGKDVEQKTKMMGYLWIIVAFLKVLKDMDKRAEDIFVLHDANEGPFFLKPATQREINMFEHPTRVPLWPKKSMVFMSNVLLDCDDAERTKAVVSAMRNKPFIKFNNSDRAAILNTLAGIPPAGNGSRDRSINFRDVDSVRAALNRESPLFHLLGNSDSVPTGEM